MRKSVFVTGKRGLLGTALVRKAGKFANIIDHDLDITSQSSLKKFSIKYQRVDWIIHTAAITNVAICEKNPGRAYEVNVMGTKNVLNLARNLNARLIYISTSSVFRGDRGNYREDDLPYPVSYYDLTKYLGELLSLEYEKSLIIRTGLLGIHSKNSSGQNFLDWLLKSFTANNNITLFKDVIVNPLSNWTLSDVIYKLMDLKLTKKIIHLGTIDTMSKADIGRLVIKKMTKENPGSMKHHGKIKYTSIDNIKGNPRPKKMWLNVNRIQKEYGIKMPTMKDEIDKIFSNR